MAGTKAEPSVETTVGWWAARKVDSKVENLVVVWVALMVEMLVVEKANR